MEIDGEEGGYDSLLDCNLGSLEQETTVCEILHHLFSGFIAFCRNTGGRKEGGNEENEEDGV